MASYNGGKRKKRAWRKPREAIGPGVLETSSDSKPSLAKIIRQESEREEKRTPSPASEAMDTAAAEQGEQETSSEVKDRVASGGDGSGGVSQRVGVEQKKQEKMGGAGEIAVTTSKATASGSLLAQSSTAAPVEIDGAVLEGGGQILRIAMAISCLLMKPIHITRIRAGRTDPGLKPQHLTGIRLLSELSGGKLEGDFRGSSDVTFHPKLIEGGNLTADTQTAGSVCLLLQAALPPLLFAARASKITLKGGTNADMAPPIDYTLKVFQPIAAKFGVHFDCQLKKRGFYPKGRGEVIVSPTPLKEITPVVLTDRGHLTRLKIHAFVAGAVRPQVSHQMVHAARRVLERQLSGVPIKVSEVQETQQSAYGNSSGIFILAETSTGCLFAGSANGRKTEASDKTARAAADELVRNVRAGGCVDEHLQDQLIILMVLAKGRSVVKCGPISLHTQTALHIAELLTQAKFTIEKSADSEKGEKTNIITCEGIGLVNERI